GFREEETKETDYGDEHKPPVHELFGSGPQTVENKRSPSRGDERRDFIHPAIEAMKMVFPQPIAVERKEQPAVADQIEGQAPYGTSADENPEVDFIETGRSPGGELSPKEDERKEP